MQEVSSNTFIPPHPLKTAVLFLIFNRPDTTKEVFEAIRRAKPPRLYVAADGPRDEKSGEGEKCERVRRIATKVDWDCEIKTLFREQNLGCKMAVSSAIDWFFDHVHEGIILEDDCLPSQSFFWFCQELLERYRDDKRVMTISGNNFYKGPNLSSYSYYFSRYPLIWGWATWKEAWEAFDPNMSLWPKIRDQGNLKYGFEHLKTGKYWEKIFQEVYDNKIDTWDYAWTFASWINNGLSILPNVNLVSNIGFGMDATHTTGDPGSGSLISRDMTFPLRHMPHMMRDSKADRFIQANHFSPHIVKIIFSRAIFSIVCQKAKSIFLYFFRKATAKNNRGEIN